jgi:RNA polymerase sigma-70 factor, ECF subfamily
LSTGAVRSGQWSGVTTSVARLALAAPLGHRADAPAPAAPARPSFDEIYEAHFDLVWRTARRLGVPESAAPDVVQDTFLVLHRRFADYDGTTPMRAWLLGIALRVVADHRRRFRRKEAPCVPHAADSQGDVAMAASGPRPNEEAEQAETVRLLEQLLAELDKDKREVLVLAQLEEMSVPEIAHALGVNVNTVYARLRAAKRDFDAAYARHRARGVRRLR